MHSGSIKAERCYVCLGKANSLLRSIALTFSGMIYTFSETQVALIIWSAIAEIDTRIMTFQWIKYFQLLQSAIRLL